MSTTTKPDLFLDSSALIAGVISARGAARALLLMAESDHITLTISKQVIVETERALARKAPQGLPYYREALRYTRPRIVRDPAAELVAAHMDICTHATDPLPRLPAIAQGAALFPLQPGSPAR